MSTLGIGVDLVEIARIERALEKSGERLARRILCDSEYEDFASSNRPAVFLAKSFAVKEAVSKALGTGISQGVRFHDISLTRLPSGQPQVKLDGAALKRLAEIGAQRMLVSISDEAGLVIAYAQAVN